MKFYISAKWHLKETVTKIQDYLIREGHEITSDWTKRAFARSYESNTKQSDEYSQEELVAILNADVFIHISDQDGKGKYVDLGIALAGKQLQNKPSIYVIGDPANESQFYFNKLINRIVTKDYFKTLEDILKKEDVSNKH